MWVTRSRLFRRAAAVLLPRRRDRQAIESYVAGYRNQPETEGEVDWPGSPSCEVMAAYPWNEDSGRGRGS